MAIQTNVYETPTIVGQALNATSTTQKVEMGRTVTVAGSIQGEATYVQALSVISQYNWVVIDEDGKVSNMTIANSNDDTGISRKVGIAQVSIPASSYAWVHTKGKVTGKVAQACNDHVVLFPTATPGVVDDATSSTGGVLAGCYTVTTTSTASAITVVMATNAFTFPWSNPA